MTEGQTGLICVAILRAATSAPGGKVSCMGRNGGGGSFSGGGGSFGGGGNFSGGGHFGGGGSFGSGGRNGSSGRNGGSFSGGFGGGDDFGGGGFGNRPTRGPIIMGPIFTGGSRGYGGARMRGIGCGSILAVIIVIAIIAFIAMVPMSDTENGSDIEVRASTAVREKIEGHGYQNEVYDNLHWLSSPSAVASGIRPFYDKTGVQPVIYLENNPNVIGDQAAQREEAQRIWDELDLTPSDFLFVYFDNDGTDGDWITWVGESAGTVMDQEAIQIFGDYLNKYWTTSGLSEDDMFIDTFNDTADRIMTKTTTANDIWMYVWIAIAVIAAGVVIFVLMKQKRKHEAEKAAETERILKTDINNLNSDDPLLNKYNKNK